MYDGTITHTYADPNLIESLDTTDGGKFYILHDPEPTSPDEWDCPATLYLTGRSRGQYTVGVGCPDGLADAVDRWGWGNPLVVRYMQLMHGVEAKPVALEAYREYAEGYVVLDNLDSTHGADCQLKPGEAEELLTSVADVWKTYWSGEVYGFIHVTADGDEDSCWGFYGDPSWEGVLDEMTDHAGVTLAR